MLRACPSHIIDPVPTVLSSRLPCVFGRGIKATSAGPRGSRAARARGADGQEPQKGRGNYLRASLHMQMHSLAPMEWKMAQASKQTKDSMGKTEKQRGRRRRRCTARRRPPCRRRHARPPVISGFAGTAEVASRAACKSQYLSGLAPNGGRLCGVFRPPGPAELCASPAQL